MCYKYLACSTNSYKSYYNWQLINVNSPLFLLISAPKKITNTKLVRTVSSFESGYTSAIQYRQCCSSARASFRQLFLLLFFHLTYRLVENLIALGCIDVEIFIYLMRART